MKKYIPYIIIIFLALVSFNLYTTKRTDNNRYNANIKALNDSIKYSKNKIGEVVASKLALQLTNKELKEQSKGSTEDNKRLKEAIKGYKKIIATSQVKQEVRIDTIEVRFKDTIKHVFSKDIEVIDKWYRFNQKVSNKGFKITNFSIFNNQTTVVGWKKQGLFKNPIANIEITNTNPYFNTLDVKPIIVTYKRVWYEKPLITIPLGIFIGLIAN